MLRLFRKLKYKVRIIIGAIILSSLGLTVSCEPARANDFVNRFGYGKPTLECISKIAQEKNLPLDLFLGINSVEMGKVGQRVQNKNTSYDIGAFQINSIHLPAILKTYGATENDVANRGCLNAYIAGDLLKNALTHPKKQHLDFYTRASGYHSWTTAHNQAYRKKLVFYTEQWRAWLSQNYK